eukprot:tig00000076_g2359.t1
MLGMLGLGSLLQATVLFVNALAVLNEERFLRKIGWTQEAVGFDRNTVKARVVGLLTAVRMLLRVPLVPLNIILIFWKLVFG